MRSIFKLIPHYFVIWVILAALAAFIAPHYFIWFKPFIVPALGIVMFGMGITLTPSDFRRILHQPKAVAVGVAAQFLFMPALGAIMARLFHLPDALCVGMILVGACPGGTASNVITYLAKADLALAVTLTAMTTLIGVVATPLLTQLYAGQYVAVDAGHMLLTVAKIVLVPVLAGLGLRHFLKERMTGILHIMPAVSVIFIVMIVACIVGLSRDSLRTMGFVLFLAVACQHAIGCVLGYGFARLMRLSKIQARTIAIEVATQDSGLGIALAHKHFADVLVALPSALYTVWQNMAGPALASFWSRRPTEE